MSDSQTRVLVISEDTIGKRLAGPGVRYLRFAQALGANFPTRLAIQASPEAARDVSSRYQVDAVHYTTSAWQSIEAEAARATVIIAPTDVYNAFPQLAHTPACLVVDCYDPLLSEWLAQAEDINAPILQDIWRQRMRGLAYQFLVGDFYICASERQRDWLLGNLEAHGRINPQTYAEDPTLRRLVDIVPSGVPDHAPGQARAVIKGRWPGIGATDRLILWGGGLWPWLDALSAIRAMPQVTRAMADARLVFPGTKRPTVGGSLQANNVDTARALARELGLLDSAVHFGDWIDFDDWESVLLESDVAITLHNETLESRLAFRTRTLDCFWAGLSTVATRGDATADLIERYDVGMTVAPGDVDAIAAALIAILTAGKAPAAKFERLRAAYTLEASMRALDAFCAAPRRAPDRQHVTSGAPYYQQSGDQPHTIKWHWDAFRRRPLHHTLSTLRRALRA
jgi:glycosyltransferase involved in cell wall biosynthesis